MRTLLIGLLAALLGLTTGCASEDAADAPAASEPAASEPAAGPMPERVIVATPWARPGSEGGMSALYAQIRNGTAAADTLRAVTTAAANTVEIHESYENEDGTRGMRPVGPVPVGAGETVSLAPGGLHVMLIRLNRALQPGDSLAVDFHFAQAGPRSMAVPIRMQPPQ